MKGKIVNVFSLIKRKWKASLVSCLFFVSLACGFAIGYLAIPDTYFSEAHLTTTRDIDNKAMASITTIVKSHDPVLETYEKLLSEGVSHVNGDCITYDEIAKGLSDWYLNTNAIIKIYFKSTDKTIVKTVLDTHLSISIKYIENQMEYLNDKVIVSSFGSIEQKLYNNRYQVIISLPISVSLLSYLIISYIETIHKKQQGYEIDV